MCLSFYNLTERDFFSALEEARLSLAKWYNEVEELRESSLNKVLDTFENHYRTILNYFDERLTNASAESFNAKIKALRSQFRGVGDIKRSEERRVGKEC